MYPRATVLLLVVWAAGALPARVFGAPVQSGASARPDSAEVERRGQGPTLEPSDLRFLPFAGKHVRRIRVTNLDVFGGSVDDTLRVSKSRLARFANRLNFRTRAITVRHNLLLREGDPIDPLRVAESERILRNLSYLGDARIRVSGAAGGDSADVLVIVKESWTLQVSESLKEGNRLKVGLAEQNLLGLGHQVSAAITVIPKIGPRLDAKYSVLNIRGSFVSGRAEYLDMPGNRTTAFGLSRELISPFLVYAGGLDLRRIAMAATDTLPSGAGNTSNLADLWAGRSLYRWLGRANDPHPRVVFVSARVRRLDYTRRPPVTASTLFQFHDQTHVLGSLTYIRSWYYRTNLLFNFGRTEDVPYGVLARVTGGLADEEFNRRPYGAATLAAGQKIMGLGYGVGELRLGGHVARGRIEQGVFRLRALYFSALMHAGTYRFRHFLRAEYVTGIHRFAGESIEFDGDESIRGVIYDSSVTGSKRLQLNLESVTFTPWRVGGVSFAFFTFADLDFIGFGRRSVLAQDLYSGLGLGLRLHKDGFGIGPVQLRFAWYPKLPIHHASRSFTAFAEERFRSIELLGTRPEIVEY